MSGDRLFNFGFAKLPAGYIVIWHEGHEHYQGHGPNEWESDITCDPWQAYGWCMQHRAAGLPASGGDDVVQPQAVRASSEMGGNPQSSAGHPSPTRWRCEKCGQEWWKEVPLDFVSHWNARLKSPCPGPVLPVNQETP